jgi:hypothetical protein
MILQHTSQGDFPLASFLLDLGRVSVILGPGVIAVWNLNEVCRVIKHNWFIITIMGEGRFIVHGVILQNLVILHIFSLQVIELLS